MSKLTGTPLQREPPPRGGFGKAIAKVWRRQSTVIAGFGAAAVLGHLLLRFGVRTSTGASHIPLLAALNALRAAFPPHVISDL